MLENACRFGPISIPVHGKGAGEAEMTGAQAALILQTPAGRVGRSLPSTETPGGGGAVTHDRAVTARVGDGWWRYWCRPPAGNSEGFQESRNHFGEQSFQKPGQHSSQAGK